MFSPHTGDASPVSPPRGGGGYGLATLSWFEHWAWGIAQAARLGTKTYSLASDVSKNPELTFWVSAEPEEMPAGSPQSFEVPCPLPEYFLFYAKNFTVVLGESSPFCLPTSLSLPEMRVY